MAICEKLVIFLLLDYTNHYLLIITFMPELPEVQTIVNDLKARVCGLVIVDVWSDTPKIFKKPSFIRFKKDIQNMSIVDVQRRGKNIIFYLQNIKKSEKKFKIMLVHQKMTGHFLIGKWVVKKISEKSILIPRTIGPIKDDKYNSYIRVIFYLNNGNQLALSDLRKFSKIILGDPDEIENSSDLKMLGPDALSNEFNAKYLSPILKRKNIPIKTALLDQHIASGIGNIYADESLFVSKIHPLIKTRELSQKNVIHLLDSVKKVLKKSLRLRGTSSSDYRDTYGSKGKYHQHRLVYNREGLPCLICKTAIKRIKIGQRSSHFCPHCQKFK